MPQSQANQESWSPWKSVSAQVTPWSQWGPFSMAGRAPRFLSGRKICWFKSLWRAKHLYSRFGALSDCRAPTSIASLQSHLSWFWYWCWALVYLTGFFGLFKNVKALWKPWGIKSMCLLLILIEQVLCAKSQGWGFYIHYRISTTLWGGTMIVLILQVRQQKLRECTLPTFTQLIMSQKRENNWTLLALIPKSMKTTKQKIKSWE